VSPSGELSMSASEEVEMGCIWGEGEIRDGVILGVQQTNGDLADLTSAVKENQLLSSFYKCGSAVVRICVRCVDVGTALQVSDN
jgi:hypothetical protein